MTTLLDLPPPPVDKVVRRYGDRVRELHGISAASIAEELGIQERTVVMIQRKIGLRACRPPGRRDCD